MRLFMMAAVTVLASGCGAYYEEVPAFGQSDPTTPYVEQQQQVADNTTQVQPTTGQEVNLDAQPADDYTDTDPSALTDFKSTLDPYGTWEDDSQYGTVWQPDPGVVGADFQPYVTAGHWAYDDDDYVWVSDFDWGWAPFHYGRWAYVRGRGWCWIPGRRYAGAWVSWRVGDPDLGYIGWGPLAPSWYWRDGTAYDIGWSVPTPYVFCGTRDFFSPSLVGRTLAGPQVGLVAGRTHEYTGGRTPAHPIVGPPPSRYGLHPPPVPATSVPGLARARAFARPSTAVALGARGPAYQHPQQVPWGSRGLVGSDRPIVTAPQYRGVTPHPYPGPSYSYRGPAQMPYRVAPSTPYARPYGGGPAYRGGPVYGGSPVYRGGQAYRGGAPSYDRPGPAYRSYGRGPVYRGGGGGGIPAPQPSYTHPSRGGGSFSGGSHFGGGGGHFGGGHFGGGGHHR